MVSQQTFLIQQKFLTSTNARQRYGIPGHYVEDGNDVIAVYEKNAKK